MYSDVFINLGIISGTGSSIQLPQHGMSSLMRAKDTLEKMAAKAGCKLKNVDLRISTLLHISAIVPVNADDAMLLVAKLRIRMPNAPLELETGVLADCVAVMFIAYDADDITAMIEGGFQFDESFAEIQEKLGVPRKTVTLEEVVRNFLSTPIDWSVISRRFIKFRKE